MIDTIKMIVENLGNLLLEWRDQKRFAGQWQGSQFKAGVDLMAHQELTQALVRLTPTIPVISEEDPASIGRKRPNLYWLIDPIDGTASFVHGYDGFVTQVALVEKGRLLMSAVYAPVFKSLYWAEQGKGAFCNKKRLNISSNAKLNILIDNYPEPRGIAQQVYNHFGFSSYLECGSIGLKICKVAAGEADLFIKDVVVRDWDLAAPQLVLEEAGGTLCYIDGNKPIYQNAYEHIGLIATPSEEIAQRLVEWHDENAGSR